MIIFKDGDLTEVKHGYIVHGCNDCGVMGSGVAKAIRDKFPSAYTEYRKWFESHCSTYKEDYLPLGEYQCISTNSEDLVVVNAITQHEYMGFRGVRENRRYVSYWAIYKILYNLQLGNTEFGDYKDIHIPRIGAGLGGGDWNEILKHITRSHETFSDRFDIVIWDLK